MNKNEAPWDRIARTILGIVMLYLGWAGVVEGGLGTTLKYLGFVPLVTGLMGWCPIYWIAKFRARASSSSTLNSACSATVWGSTV